MMESVSKVVLLLACFVSSLCAQFSGLSATRDGATVYFSSPLRLRNSNGNFDAKLYRISNEDLALFREQERGRSLGWYNEHFYNLTTPQVSTDGSMIAFAGVRTCSGGSGCISVQTRQGIVVDLSGKVLVSAFGSVDISPNGQYALFFARNAFGSQIPATELISVTTGARTTLPYRIAATARRRVANDGTVVVVAQDSIRLWQAGNEQTLTGVSAGPRSDSGEPLLLIGADGRRIVCETPAGLVRYDRSTASQEVLAAPVPQSISIDENATVVAWVDPSDSQIYVTSPFRQLTREPEGIAEVALSGSGSVAFAVTHHGRMLRIDIASGTASELIPRTPFITNPPLAGLHTYIYDAIAPGSLIPLTGIGLSSSSQSAAPPLPRTLGGVTVRIAGVPAAIQAVSPNVVWVQVPWELQEQRNAPFEFLSGDSSFETGPGTVNITARAPHSFATADTSQGNIYITAVHEDWSALVTRSSPARSGEIVTVYLNGLGPVAPALATGQSSPADPPARVVGPFRCQFWDGSPNDSRLYFAGLAPGMVGVYQVSLEVPAGLRVSSPALSCDFGPGSGAVSVGSIFVLNQ